MADVDAICATFVELASKFRHHRPSSRLFERVVVSSPTLRGRIRERQEESAKHIAGAIATRRGLSRADEASRLMADIAQETHRRALIAWREQTTGELGDAIVEEFALLKNTF
jgi:transcriptional regulator MftR-like protein